MKQAHRYWLIFRGEKKVLDSVSDIISRELRTCRFIKIRRRKDSSHFKLEDVIIVEVIKVTPKRKRAIRANTYHGYWQAGAISGCLPWFGDDYPIERGCNMAELASKVAGEMKTFFNEAFSSSETEGGKRC